MGKFLIILLISIFKFNLSFQEWWENSIVFEFTKDNVSKYVGSNKYIIIEFFTKWCQYCKFLFPIYEELYKRYNETRKDILIGRINCEFNPETCEHFGIFAFPNIVLFLPNSNKINNIFTHNRDIYSLLNWVNTNCPVIVKKNLKGNNNNTTRINLKKKIERTTEETEYFKRRFISIKEQLNEIEKKIKKINQTNRTTKKTIKKIKKNVIIKIKINSKTFLFVLIGIFLFILFNEFSFSFLLKHSTNIKSL